jgi:hypothetical protein
MTMIKNVGPDDVVTWSEPTPAAKQQVVVGKVLSLVPPKVKIPGRDQPVRITGRAPGLTVAVDDLVMVVRVGADVVAICKVEGL